MVRHCNIDSSFSSPFKTDWFGGVNRAAVSFLSLDGDVEVDAEDVKIDEEAKGVVPEPEVCAEAPHKMEDPGVDEVEKRELDPNAEELLLLDPNIDVFAASDDPNPEVVFVSLFVVPKPDIGVELDLLPKVVPKPALPPNKLPEVEVPEVPGVDFVAFANAAANGFEFLAESNEEKDEVVDLLSAGVSCFLFLASLGPSSLSFFSLDSFSSTVSFSLFSHLSSSSPDNFLFLFETSSGLFPSSFVFSDDLTSFSPSAVSAVDPFSSIFSSVFPSSLDVATVVLSCGFSSDNDFSGDLMVSFAGSSEVAIFVSRVEISKAGEM